MNITIQALLSLMTAFTAFAGEEAKPTFHHVSEFLTWADKKIAADDYDALITAQADTKDSRQTQLIYIKTLDRGLKGRTLAKIYEGREFPEEAATFKLGGHGMELGHCHIEFSKKGDSWGITRI
jgi:nicotinamide riboside kinase